MKSYLDGYAARLDKVATVDQETSGANAAVSITLTARAGYRHYLPMLLWSYSAAPTGGRLTITGVQGDDVDIDITAGGPGEPTFPPCAGEVSTAVVITLAAGGAGIIGKINAWSATLPASPTTAGLALNE